ncbi:hypothetical protein LCGC14_0020760 [marine sediment metagenome]|uniref:NolW-like domain-containing protein n=2 Tax=root TaxID=1 RepID=A0A0F9VZY9_9ZZZZ
MTCFLRTLALRLITPVVGAIMLSTAVASVAQEGTGERAVIDIIQIMHRDPGQIRESVRPVLDPRGSIGQMDDKLIIATTASNLLQIQDIIADTDVLPRRLVIGVDFAYSSELTGTDGNDANASVREGQQQSQAIEGQQLVFIAGTDGTDDSEVSNPARITIAAEILPGDAAGNLASVNVILDNVPGLTGSHIMRVPLGVWQRIPVPVPETLDGTDNTVENGTDVSAAADDATSPINADVAVRVDRVP